MKKILLIFLSVFAFASVYADITWDLSEDGTLTISGTSMQNVIYNRVPWYYSRDKIKKVVIENGVANISSNAFYYCSNLTSVSIPNSVTSIGPQAFSGCKSLTSITLPNSLTGIGESAFSSCSSLTSVVIPNSVTFIDRYAFNYCSNLKSVILSNSLTSIDYGVFKGCQSLTTITIPNSVTSIGESAFSSCSSLTSIVVSNSVTDIESQAFGACPNIKEIYLLSTTPPLAIGAFTKSTDNSPEYGTSIFHTRIFVPEGCAEIYKYSPEWNVFAHIYEMEYTPVLPAANPTSITDVAPTVTNGYYKENTVSYIRESSAISEDNYASFCLPFAVDATDTQFKAVYVPVGLALYNGEANTLRIGFYKTNEILPAGTPFLAKLAVNNKVEVKNALPVNYSDKTPDVKNSVIRTFDYSENSGIMNNNTSFDINFSGTYTRISPANANTFNIDGSVGPSASVVPFRAYIDLAKNSSNAKILSLFNEESETTGIKLVERIVSDAAAYNLAGQRISPLKAKGVMIINGKKYVK